MFDDNNLFEMSSSFIEYETMSLPLDFTGCLMSEQKICISIIQRMNGD